MLKLAVDGGPKVFETPAPIAEWPPIYPETGKKLLDVYNSRRWSFYGPEETLFNREFAEFTGADTSIMMANGTVTLEMAMQALDIGPGDEVIVPAHTWLATGEAVVYRGAVPVIVDIDPETLCIDPAKIEEAITPKTKAIIPVHLFGSFADMEAIMAIAEKYQLKVIEDCAHSPGGFWRGKHVGTIGDVGSFSFQQSKCLASGEGGACITNNEDIAETLGRLSHIGYQFGAKQGQKCTPPPLGLICHNYRVTDFQAVILRDQLKHLREDSLLRERNAEYLRKKLDAIPGIRVQARSKDATLQSYYVFAIMVDHNRLKPGITRTEVIAALNAEGVMVEAGWGFPMYRQILWTVPEEKYRISSNAVAEDIVINQLMQMSLSWLMMPESELDKIAEAFEKVMGHYYSEEK